MDYRRLGITGIKVSRICLGTNNFGGQLDEQRVQSVIKKALDLGINILDTANTYTKGRSEELIGEAIKGNRNEILIATKVGEERGGGPNQGGLSRKEIVWQVSESLRRLQTDYIDLYYMHRFDPETPLEETLRALDYLVKQGKILYVACSNFTVAQVSKAIDICERLALERIVAVQPLYNLVQREAGVDLLPFCREKSLAVLPYSPLMGGFLTGKYASGKAPPPESRGYYNKMYWEQTNKGENYMMVESFRQIANQASISTADLAIAWLLKNPAVTAPIVGASSPEQVEKACEVLGLRIPEDAMKRLESVKGPAS